MSAEQKVMYTQNVHAVKDFCVYASESVVCVYMPPHNWQESANFAWCARDDILSALGVNTTHRTSVQPQPNNNCDQMFV